VAAGLGRGAMIPAAAASGAAAGAAVLAGRNVYF
jgi:hypothetical protein